MSKIVYILQAPPELVIGPTTHTVASDDAFGAYGRDTLYFILPLMETYLDKLSFWNQGVFQYFLRKVFYNKSNLQCNSLYTVNGRPHDHNLSGSVYPPFGFQPDAIYKLIWTNLYAGEKYNPLFSMLEEFKNMYLQVIYFYGHSIHCSLRLSLHIENDSCIGAAR